jgi:hypothetical protein
MTIGYPIHKRLEERKYEKGQHNIQQTSTFISNNVRSITAKVFNNDGKINTRKRRKDDDDMNEKKSKKLKGDNCMTIDMNRRALIGSYPSNTERIPEQGQ